MFYVVILTVGVFRTLMLGVRETVILGPPPSRLRVDGVFLCGPVLAQVRRCSRPSTSSPAQVATHTEAAASQTSHPIILNCVLVIHTCGRTQTTRVVYDVSLQPKMIHSQGVSETFGTQALLRPLQ